MKASDGKKTMTLSMRLLRDGRTIEDSLRSDHELREIDAKTGRVFIGQTPATPPVWLGFVNDFVNIADMRLANQSCGSVLFLQVPDPARAKYSKTLALAFGTGHHSLNPDAFERNFGLRVVLNSVSRSSLRSLCPCRLLGRTGPHDGMVGRSM